MATPREHWKICELCKSNPIDPIGDWATDRFCDWCTLVIELHKGQQRLDAMPKKAKITCSVEDLTGIRLPTD